MSVAEVYPSAFDRREFLRIGSVAALAVSASGLLAPAAFAANAENNSPLLGIGYTPVLPAVNSPVRLANASSILTGDPSFLARGARVTIGSFARAAKQRGNPSGVAVDAIYPVRGYVPEKYPRFRAFSAVGRTDYDSASYGVSFGLPVTAAKGMQLVVRRIKPNVANTPDVDLAIVSLGVNSGGTANLQRGAYVLTFRETGAENVPEWNMLTLSVDAAKQYSINSTDYSSVVVLVDYKR